MHRETLQTIIAESEGVSFSVSRSPFQSLPRSAASFWRTADSASIRVSSLSIPIVNNVHQMVQVSLRRNAAA